MPDRLYISSATVISNNSVYKNGQEIFSGPQGSEVAEFLNAAYKSFRLSYPKFYKMDNLCKLGWLAAEVLMHVNTENEPKEMGNQKPDPGSVSVLLCNASSSLDTDRRYFQTVNQMASPALFVYTLPNIVIGEICIRNGWKGENAFLITENFDAAFFYEQVRLLLSDEQNRICVCGWVELLGQEYKACLFAVEKVNGGQNINFTKKNIESVFNSPGKTIFKGQIKKHFVKSNPSNSIYERVDEQFKGTGN